MHPRTLFATATTCLIPFFIAISSSGQGDLTPPGPPAPSMKSLDQVCPGKPLEKLPYAITNTGLFFLTGPLTGTAGSDGISIAADDVVLDLGGFALQGVSNSGVGIIVTGPQTGITVRNGTVRGWGKHGIDAGHARNCLIERLNVNTNGSNNNYFDGIVVGTNALVRDCVTANNRDDGLIAHGPADIRGCISSHNGDDGIFAEPGVNITECVSFRNGDDGIEINVSGGGTISGCTSYENGEDGIHGGPATCVTRCSSYGNGSDGIDLGPGSVVSDSVARDNGDDGIAVAEGGTVSHCSSSDNTSVGILATYGGTVRGNSTSANGSDGIRVDSGCAVMDNTCRQDGERTEAAGISVTGNRNRIDGNTVTGIDIGIEVLGSNNFIVRNFSSGNTNNFSILPGNINARIESGVTNGFQTAEAWLNFSF